VVIGDLDFEGIGTLPAEHDAPLIVHSDAVEPLKVADKSFQSITWRGSQIAQSRSGVKHVQFADSNSMYIGRYCLEGLFGTAVKEGLCGQIGK